MDKLREAVPVKALPIVDCITLFSLVVTGSFGRNLSSDIGDKIKRFSNSFETLMQYAKVTNL